MKRLLLATGCVLLLTGCFDIEVGVKLERDLSGTATMDMTIDMEPMAYVMAAMEKSFSGEEGAPTAEEIAAARAELLAETQDEEKFDIEELRQEAEADLPEGITLVDAAQSSEGLKQNIKIILGFDDVSRLDEISFDDPEQSGDPTEQNPLEKPFEGLRFVDEGDSYLLESDPINPYEDQVESGQIPMGGEEMIARIFENLRFVFSFETPFDVIEHNATRVEGRKLIWEYKLTELSGSEVGSIRARFRK